MATSNTISELAVYLKRSQQQFGASFIGAGRRGQVTLPHHLALNIIYQKGSVKMTDLAELMCATTPAVTGLINRLLEKELVTRYKIKEDRRQVIVTLTPKGVEYVTENLHKIEERLDESLKGLSENELKTLDKIIAKLAT